MILLFHYHLPEDPDAVSGIREIAEKGGAKNADHTLQHVDAFARWHKVLAEAGEEKSLFPGTEGSPC